MSLTSHLKDNNSLVKQMFDTQFDNINLFLREENKKIKNLSIMIPADELNYPWATVGHITYRSVFLAYGSAKAFTIALLIFLTLVS